MTNLNRNRSEDGIIDATAINTEATSSTVEAAGYSTATFYVDYTFGAGTNVELRVDQSNDGGTTWFLSQLGDASTPATYPLVELVVSKAAGAANQVYVTPPVPIDCSHLRARVVATGSPTASDVVTLDVRLGAHGSAVVAN